MTETFRRAAGAATLSALVLAGTAVSSPGGDRTRDRIPQPPLAYVYSDPRDRLPDGSYEFVWYGVYVRAVSSRRSGAYTGDEHRYADVSAADVGSRGTGLLERLRPRGRGTCFHARFHVRLEGSELARKRPGDRVRVRVRFPGRPPAVRTAVLREGGIDEESAGDRRRIRRAGCTPPRPIG